MYKEPIELLVVRFLLGLLMVCVYSLFTYVYVHIEPEQITIENLIIDEVKADFRNQLREELKWK